MKGIPFSTRDRYAHRLEEAGGKLKALGRFIRGEEGPTPCWGGIAQYLQQHLGSSGDQQALLEVVLAEQDLEPIVLFLHTSRACPKVLEALCERASELPAVAQMALVSLEEAALFAVLYAEQFSHQAQQLLAGPESRRADERELFEARIARLLNFDLFVPDSRDPRHESDSINPTSKEEK